MNPLFKSITATLVIVAIASFSAGVSAAEVQAGLSTRETYVGMPVTFRVQISNATDVEPPKVPKIPGVRVESSGVPSRSTQTTIINGNVTTRSSVTYSFSVTPTRSGSFRIPSIDVRADGKTLSTRPFEFVASKSETGDLLFVEIAGKEKQIYVGQSLDLTLRIWVRPYRDQERNVTLNDGDMWQLISKRTDWGPFAERIQQLAKNDQRPVGTEVLRNDREGVSHSYYRYEIDATIYPKKPGQIDAKDVHVVALYPTALGESHDMFDSFFGGRFESPFAPRLTIESVRPIVAEAKVDPIDVMEIPTVGRPADYRGAVGKYHIATEASPTKVKVGDPINLLIGIAGTGPMDLVQAPPLAELAELTAVFKVPNEPLAGFSKGERKAFSTTIRPRKDDVHEIPAIPFCYFDPETGEFVTVRSQPISIEVEPAEMLALDAVIGRSQASSNDDNKSSGLTAADMAPSLTNLTGDGLLVSESPATLLPWTLWLAIALPPLAVFGLFVLRHGRRFAALPNRFGSSLNRCQHEIENAEKPSDVALSMKRYFVRRIGLGSGALDAAALVGALRSSGYRHLAVRCERILQQCEGQGGARFDGAISLDTLKADARQIVAELQMQRSRRASTPRTSAWKTGRRRSATSTSASVLLLIGLTMTGVREVCAQHQSASPLAESSEVILSTEQQKALLAEATASYDRAMGAAANDSAESKVAYADAAEKYQLLVDAGVRNSGLYFNLGNAYLQSGEHGRAIANYHRSLRIDPANWEARANLRYAESLVPSQPKRASTSAASWTDYAVSANEWLNHFIGTRSLLFAGVFGWFVLWAAIGLATFGFRLPWKSIAVLSLALAVVAATSYSLSRQVAARHVAVVVSSATEVRSGDGAGFPIMTGNQLSAGEVVEYRKRRSDWVQIQAGQGTVGWLPAKSVEIL